MLIKNWLQSGEDDELEARNYYCWNHDHASLCKMNSLLLNSHFCIVKFCPNVALIICYYWNSLQLSYMIAKQILLRGFSRCHSNLSRHIIRNKAAATINTTSEQERERKRAFWTQSRRFEFVMPCGSQTREAISRICIFTLQMLLLLCVDWNSARSWSSSNNNNDISDGTVSNALWIKRSSRRELASELYIHKTCGH